MPIDAEEVARLRDLCEKATPGPWCMVVSYGTGEVEGVAGGPVAGGSVAGLFRVLRATEADAEFVAVARAAIPALLDEVERLRNEVRQLRERVNRYERAEQEYARAVREYFE